MAGGKSSSSNSSAFGDILGGIAEKINKEVDPVRKMFLSQMKQVLSGNQFTNSNLPLIQSGVAAARQAGAASTTETQGYLSKTGVAQSPFAAAIMSLTSQGSNEAIGAVPRQVSEAVLGQIPSAVSGIGGQAISGLASAGQLNNRSSSSSMSWDAAQGATGIAAILGA